MRRSMRRQDGSGAGFVRESLEAASPRKDGLVWPIPEMRLPMAGEV